MSIKSKIQALIAAANAKTGESDATLTDAVQTLVDGYGQGGGSGNEDALISRSLSGSYTNSRVSAVGEDALRSCVHLTSVAFPAATTIGARAFTACSNLVTASAPMAAQIQQGCFDGCSKLTAFDFAAATSTGAYAFQNCKSLVSAKFPSLATVGGMTFANCSSLSAVDFVNRVNFAPHRAFNNCAALSTLILRGETLSTLGNVNTFDGTPFKNGGTGGTIYVPKALYDHLGDGSALDYKAATNWSTVDGYGTITWAQIEGSQYENYYVDGTPIA